MCAHPSPEQSWLVAVASSDGETINRHFGQASEFLVYRLLANGESQLEDRRLAPEGLDPHEPESFRDLFHGVDVVLVNRAGPGAIQACDKQGVRCYSVEGPIRRALERFASRGAILTATPHGSSKRSGGGCKCGPGGGGGGGCS